VPEVLVDTTVWIDFFHDRPLPHVVTLQELIENDDDVCVCGVILTEVLQGIRKDADYRKTRDYFESLVFLPMRRATFLRAADVYRSLRKKGVTIRKSVDCLIAAVAIEYNVPLLHNDRDFDQIATGSKLKIFNVPK
jgi:predicted nucleic acid-binding protein